jgi:NADPH:quinone reductase-like Zn-dependent oxidoreductase
MRALAFERRDLSDLKVRELPDPRPGPHEILIRVKQVGLNPVDLMTITSLPVRPFPHVPGVEFSGLVEEVGEEVRGLGKGAKVAVYTRTFDGSCPYCLAGREMLCLNGGRIGVDQNGGLAEYVVVPALNVLPSDLDWDVLSSLPVSALTPYHALLEARIRPGEVAVILGASGNTGQFAVQLAKLMGVEVIAVSRRQWVRELGADQVVGMGEVLEEVRKITGGRMADIVLNSLGREFWGSSLKLLGVGGRLVTFGTLTGAEVEMGIGEITSRHSILGTTRGSLGEFRALLKIAGRLKVKVWRKLPLEEGAEAFQSLSSKDGRVFLVL